MQLRLGLALLEGRNEKRASGKDPCRAHTSPLRDTSRLATLPTCRAAVLLTLLPAWAVASITLDHWGSRAAAHPGTGRWPGRQAGRPQDTWETARPASRFVVLLPNTALTSKGFFLGLAVLRTVALRHPSRGPCNVVEGTEPGSVGSGHLRVIWMSSFHSLGLFLFLQNEEGGQEDCFSQLGPWTSDNNNIWELIRKAGSLTSLETCCIRHRGWTRHSVSTQPPGHTGAAHV